WASYVPGIKVLAWNRSVPPPLVAEMFFRLVKLVGVAARTSIVFPPGPPVITMLVIVEAAAAPVPGFAPSTWTFPFDALMTIGSLKLLETVKTPATTPEVIVGVTRPSRNSRAGLCETRLELRTRRWARWRTTARRRSASMMLVMEVHPLRKCEDFSSASSDQMHAIRTGVLQIDWKQGVQNPRSPF